MALEISEPISVVGCTDSKYSEAEDELPVSAGSVAVAKGHARTIGIAQNAAHRFLDDMY
ncbi:hypothetical protein TOC8171_51210 [Pseudomonas syringae]